MPWPDLARVILFVLLTSCQGCWAGLDPWLDFVQWMLRVGMPILGFTPVCTMAKELAVALASSHLTKTENFQAHTFTATGESWSINKGQCYIRKVRAESVCPTFHLRMFSDSGTISPGPGWPDWEIENENYLAMNCNHTMSWNHSWYLLYSFTAVEIRLNFLVFWTHSSVPY